MIEDLLIDLDGTLYPISEGNDYEHHVRNNILLFMHEELGVPQAEALGIWQKAFATYNQSLKGLKMSGYAFDDAHYWDRIRQGAEMFLTPDPQVRSCLQSLPQRKWLFTNANEKSAQHCLKLLNLEGIFQGVIGADSMGDCCKPEVAAFERAFQLSRANPARTAMLEDSLKNLRTAKRLGLTTILIAGETAVEERVTRQELEQFVDASISAPIESELRSKCPQLWQQ